MKKLLVLCIFTFLLISCAPLHVYTNNGYGVSNSVKKEMIRNERRINNDKREYEKISNKRKRTVKKLQNTDWK